MGKVTLTVTSDPLKTCCSAMVLQCQMMRRPRFLGSSPNTASLVSPLMTTSAEKAVAVSSSSSATRGCSRGQRAYQTPQVGVRTPLAGTLGQPHSTRRSASGSTEKADRMSPTALRASGRSSLLCQYSGWKRVASRDAENQRRAHGRRSPESANGYPPRSWRPTHCPVPCALRGTCLNYHHLDGDIGKAIMPGPTMGRE